MKTATGQPMPVEILLQGLAKRRRPAEPDAGLLPLGYRRADLFSRQPALFAAETDMQVHPGGGSIGTQPLQRLIIPFRRDMKQINRLGRRVAEPVFHLGNKRRNANAGTNPDLARLLVGKIKTA